MTRAVAGSLSRRALLAGATGAVVACAAPVARTPREEVAAFPLVDAHSHYLSRTRASFGITPDALLAAMDAAGIRRTILLGFGPELPDLVRRHPDRLAAAYIERNFRSRQALGEIGDGTHPAEVERLGAEFEAALDTGVYRGFGEVTTLAREISARTTGGSPAPGSTVAPDSPLVLRLLEIAGRHDVPVTVHCDAPGAARMTRALRAHRRTRVIWAHLGGWLSASDCRRLLRDHVNLAFDLSAKNVLYDAPGGSYGVNALHGFGGMAGAWRELIEAHPDRFLFGVDFLAARHLSLAADVGRYYRELLASLEPPTARAVAWENATRMFSL